MSPKSSSLRKYRRSEAGSRAPSRHSPSPVAKQWERVAEGRVRALSLTEKSISRAFLLWIKSPHPPFGHPLPSWRTGEGENWNTHMRLPCPCGEGLGVGVARCSIILHDEKWGDQPTPALDSFPQPGLAHDDHVVRRLPPIRP